MKCWRTHSSGVNATYDFRKMSKMRCLPFSIIIFVSYEGRFNLNILYICGCFRKVTLFLYFA